MPEQDFETTPSGWTLVLTDWWNASARVTITLKSGIQFTGDLVKPPRDEANSLGTVTLVDSRPRVESKHTVALAEIAAITAAK
jgi:hypothetical protein